MDRTLAYKALILALRGDPLPDEFYDSLGDADGAEGVVEAALRARAKWVLEAALAGDLDDLPERELPLARGMRILVEAWIRGLLGAPQERLGTLVEALEDVPEFVDPQFGSVSIRKGERAVVSEPVARILVSKGVARVVQP